MEFHLFSFRVRLYALSILILSLMGNGNLLQGEDPAYTQLINSHTTAVIRVNRTQLNLASAVQSGLKTVSQLADTAVSDPDTAKKVKVGLPLMVAGYLTGPIALLEAMEELGINDLYFISTPGVPESPGYFALPLTGNEDEEQLESLKKGITGLRSLNVPVMHGFSRHGFVFAPVIKSDLEESELKSFIVREFKELHPEPRSEFNKAFNEFPEAGITLVYTGNSETQQQFADEMSQLQDSVQSTKNEEAISLAAEMNKTITHLAKQASYVVSALDQSDSSFKIRIRLRGGTKEAANDIKSLSNAIRLAAESGKRDEPLTEDQQELIKELTVLILPQVSKQTLDWKFDSDFAKTHKPLFERYIRLIRKDQEESPIGGTAEEVNNSNQSEEQL